MNFKDFKKRAREFYLEDKTLFCPYFNEEIQLTSDGFDHLIRKSTRDKNYRNKDEQLTRLKLIKTAFKIIRITTTVQDIQKRVIFVPAVHHGQQVSVLKEVVYWAFESIQNEKKIKVIIRQIGEGRKEFWSVVPKWRQKNKNKKRHSLTAPLPYWG